MGNIHLYYDWKWADAAAEFEEALRLNPSDYRAIAQWAHYLVVMSRPEEALAAAESARKLDPVDGEAVLGWVSFMARRYDRAVVHLKEALDLSPDPVLHARTAASYLFLGRHSEATASCDTALKSATVFDSVAAGICAYVYGATGRQDQARSLVAVLKAQKGVDSWFVAVGYAGLGQKQEALEALERAYGERSWNLFGLRMTPWWDSLRDDPRYKDLVRRMNFPD